MSFLNNAKKHVKRIIIGTEDELESDIIEINFLIRFLDDTGGYMKGPVELTQSSTSLSLENTEFAEYIFPNMENIEREIKIKCNPPYASQTYGLASDDRQFDITENLAQIVIPTDMPLLKAEKSPPEDVIMEDYNEMIAFEEHNRQEFSGQIIAYTKEGESYKILASASNYKKLNYKIKEIVKKRPSLRIGKIYYKAYK